jgi:hypothetical protein
MKTEAMQKRLEMWAAKGELTDGVILPSDCRGDGMDIAIKSRPDESGMYEVGDKQVLVECSIRVGSANWRDGIPAQYGIKILDKPPYILRKGEQAIIRHRIGTKIGSGGYMERKLASIAILREDGHLVYNGHTPYWLGSTNTYASHYISGLSQRDSRAYDTDVEILQALVNLINSTALSAVA